MREKMDDPAEAALKNCNSISLLRKAGEPFKEDILESLKPTVSLLSPA